MKIAKKKFKVSTPLLNPIIDLEMPLEKILKKGEHIATKYHNTPGDNDSRSYEINLIFFEKDHLRSGLSGKTNFSRPQMARASVQDLYSIHLLHIS